MKVGRVSIKQNSPVRQGEPGKQESRVLLIPQSPWPAASSHKRLLPFTPRYPPDTVSPRLCADGRAEKHRWNRKQARSGGAGQRTPESMVLIQLVSPQISARTLPLRAQNIQTMQLPRPLTSLCDYAGCPFSQKSWIRNRIKHHREVYGFLHNFLIQPSSHLLPNIQLQISRSCKTMF